MSEPFDVAKGVRQGCPASPLVFALYVDRLAEMVDSETREWSRWERDQVRLAGMLVPLLLFADDMVLIARTGALA